MNNKCLVCIDVYTVQSGDTLYSIASRYNISTGLLMRANMIENPYDLRIGLKLCIPGYEEELPAAPQAPTTQPETPNMPPNSQAPTHGAPNVPPNSQAPTPCMPNLPPMPTPGTPNLPPSNNDCNIPVCNGILYTIEKGDTLYMIAKKFKISLNAIIEANPGIDPYNLRIGMQLCIPV